MVLVCAVASGGLSACGMVATGKAGLYHREQSSGERTEREGAVAQRADESRSQQGWGGDLLPQVGGVCRGLCWCTCDVGVCMLWGIGSYGSRSGLCWFGLEGSMSVALSWR